MNENLIKKKYKEKIKSFNYYNKKYYDENISEISDSKFDVLKKEIIELEKKYIKPRRISKKINRTQKRCNKISKRQE